MNRKLKRLKEILANMKSVLIAYSGGVDSTLLLKVARDVLKDRVISVTARSLTYPSLEIENARKMAKELGIKHLVISTAELSNSKFINNSQKRCYWCKRELFSKLSALAKKHKLNYVLDGSNYDDLKDFRPGTKAAEELNVRSPLKDAGFTKKDIRNLSKRLGLATWNKPSLACLASRIPYGMKITEANIIKVDKAERFLRSLYLTQVRVRDYNQIARIEVRKDQIPKLLKEKARSKILNKFKQLGYAYVTVDLQGYRTGSMNKVIKGRMR